MWSRFIKLSGVGLATSVGYKVWDDQRPIKVLGEADVNRIVYQFVNNDRYPQLHRQKTCQFHVERTLNPNFRDKEQNRSRYRELMDTRRFIWCELPPDTKWYRYRIKFDEKMDQHVHLVWPSLEPPIGVPKKPDQMLRNILMFSHGNGKYIGHQS